MVPHLGDRLMDCSNEESMAMADLVAVHCTLTLLLILIVFDYRFRKVFTVFVGRRQEV